MAKAKRGTNAKRIGDWRGTCPVCKRERVKLLWTKTEGEQTLKVCKVCGK